MRNENDYSVEGLFWGRLAPTLLPVQLVRSRAIQNFLLLVSNERPHFGDNAQPRMRKRSSYTYTL